jgi:hypothetical protein
VIRFKEFGGVHGQQGGDAVPDDRAIDAGDGAFGARRYAHVAPGSPHQRRAHPARQRLHGHEESQWACPAQQWKGIFCEGAAENHAREVGRRIRGNAYGDGAGERLAEQYEGPVLGQGATNARFQFLVAQRQAEGIGDDAGVEVVDGFAQSFEETREEFAGAVEAGEED